MIKHFLRIWGFNAFVASTLFAVQKQPQIEINAILAKKIGEAIYRNECGGNPAFLIYWNAGETFPSLGIGHFIWYPASEVKRPYKETFPDLIRFIMQAKAVPEWLARQIANGAPWQSKAVFDEQYKSIQVQELRQLLLHTFDLQVAFIIKRLQEVLPQLLEHLSVQQKALVHNRFVRLSKDPCGLYALADYLNFKGDGLKDSEQYDGIRWGLLQVLLGMDDAKEPVVAFVASAECVLTKRVQAASKKRNEERWLPGWLNRVRTYKTFGLSS